MVSGAWIEDLEVLTHVLEISGAFSYFFTWISMTCMTMDGLDSGLDDRLRDLTDADWRRDRSLKTREPIAAGQVKSEELCVVAVDRRCCIRG